MEGGRQAGKERGGEGGSKTVWDGGREARREGEGGRREGREKTQKREGRERERKGRREGLGRLRRLAARGARGFLQRRVRVIRPGSSESSGRAIREVGVPIGTASYAPSDEVPVSILSFFRAT